MTSTLSTKQAQPDSPRCKYRFLPPPPEFLPAHIYPKPVLSERISQKENVDRRELRHLGTRGNQDFSKWKPLELFTEQHLGRDIEGQVGIAFLLLLTASFPSYIPPQSIHLVWSLSCLVFLPKENTLESLRQVYLACFEYSSKREKAVVSFIKKKKSVLFCTLINLTLIFYL